MKNYPIAGGSAGIGTEDCWNVLLLDCYPHYDNQALLSRYWELVIWYCVENQLLAQFIL
ncbi:MAG: hypothetical protein K9J37_08910 [Saprospiraceae bacterium]|nr:hypothetical protein [Saprospiraceae bacterium]MCF8250021.1 hypothetical protein [Saprospiraceae bacterium]MCF8278939.1 hypothetical protein [Bacteroidales bacterium]MCF8311034.1 hypothetical protein [Saprospiraceae bacterium]MCF8439630.1 hypothetical protein [Saprospiraceae bacterium]